MMPARPFRLQHEPTGLHENSHAALVRPRITEVTDDIHAISIRSALTRFIRQSDDGLTGVRPHGVHRPGPRRRTASTTGGARWPRTRPAGRFAARAARGCLEVPVRAVLSGSDSGFQFHPGASTTPFNSTSNRCLFRCPRCSFRSIGGSFATPEVCCDTARRARLHTCVTCAGRSRRLRACSTHHDAGTRPLRCFFFVGALSAAQRSPTRPGSEQRPGACFPGEVSSWE